MTSHVFWPERHWQQIVIGWNVVVFGLCIAALITTDGGLVHRFVTPIPLGVAGVFVLNDAVSRHQALRLERRFARFPTSFEVVSGDDDETIVSCELGDGGTVMVTVPGRYRPADDDGETVMRMLHPEIYA